MRLPYCIAKRIIYVVSHGYPSSSDGYAVRTHCVAKSLVQSGCDVIVVKLRTPKLSHGKSKNSFEFKKCVHDDILYLDVNYLIDASTNGASTTNRIIDALIEVIAVLKPVAVMAASNWRIAQPAQFAAKKFELPFLYEVRGFWELSQLREERVEKCTETFIKAVAKETAVAQLANKVFTLNVAMRDELIRRGVIAANIHLSPNGVWNICSKPSSHISKKTLAISAQLLIGYIGSFNDYEGLADLIEACAQLRHSGLDVALLLIGSSLSRGVTSSQLHECGATERLREVAKMHRIDKNVTLLGRISAEQAQEYYPIIDVIVIPRRPLEVCELVTPMKPLEAASFGKNVLMSDVAALKELSPIYPGFMYFRKGCIVSLTTELEKLLKHPIPHHSTKNLFKFRSWANCTAVIASEVLSLPGIVFSKGGKRDKKFLDDLVERPITVGHT